jgi:phospholipid/cholesterol/gamma-HCH transport system ATP-binding protein
MIEIRNINKSFGAQHVLHDVTCTFRPGQNNLIIGQSGSGKTVLMKCLIGLHAPDSGEVLFDGENTLNMKRDELKQLRSKVGVLFQGAALFDSMSVAENVQFPLRMLSNMTAIERAQRVKFCLERVNLRGADGKFPSELSGGMKKRVAIARAIALNPRYLFCDEPNSGLDPQTSILIDQLIDDITKEYNITTVVNTHDMNSVLGIGDNIIFLHQGHNVWQGNKSNILSTQNVPLHDFLFSSPILRKIEDAEMAKRQ